MMSTQMNVRNQQRYHVIQYRSQGWCCFSDLNEKPFHAQSLRATGRTLARGGQDYRNLGLEVSRLLCRYGDRYPLGLRTLSHILTRSQFSHRSNTACPAFKVSVNGLMQALTFLTLSWFPDQQPVEHYRETSSFADYRSSVSNHVC